MTTGPASSPGIDAALAVLAAAGLQHCGARAAGPRREVLLLSVPQGWEERIVGAAGKPLRAQLRETGFRYVALDLAPHPDVA